MLTGVHILAHCLQETREGDTVPAFGTILCQSGFEAFLLLG